jgi:outer membrane protein OmpA-like peptidoglycan-associated protein
MRTLLLLTVCYVAFTGLAAAQDYRPIELWGFNHDVIAEGPGRDAVAQTTREMDARDPSNFILFSKRFAKTLAMGPDYGLPDNGKIISGTKTFQLADFGRPNAVYLLKGERRVVSIVRPRPYDGLSVLGLATEGQASVSVIIYFIDGTSFRFGTIVFNDWFDGPDAFLKGFGRVKRDADTREKPLYYEGTPSNPRLYAIDIVPPNQKVIQSIQFQNSSPGESKESNRAFIFAISGYFRPKEIDTTSLVTDQKKKEEVPIKGKESGKELPFLHGTVTDANTHRPLDATVQFTFGSSGNVAYTIEGKYRQFKVQQLTLFDKREYLVKVSSPGYIDHTEKITAATWPAHNELNFGLLPIEVGTVVKLNGVLFKQSTAVLLPESYPELDAVAEFLTANPKVRIEVAGHTDNLGASRSNLLLSEERVVAVRKYLVGKGINGDRMTGKGYGGSKPIARNDSEANRQLNRRVEFIVTSK